MEKVSEDDAAYYRQRTVARLIDKRRQIENAEAKEAELKKTEDLKFRVQWKEGFKKKRSEMISAKVEKNILQATLRSHPDMLVQVINMEKYGIIDSVEDDPLLDLIDDYDEGEVVNTGLEHTLKSFHSGSMFPTSFPQSSQAFQFLQNAATFQLSVNHRLREQQSRHPKQSDNGFLPPDMNKPDSSPMGKGANSTTSSAFTSSRMQDNRMFASYRNEVKVNSLVLGLLHGPHTSQHTAGLSAEPNLELRRRSSSTIIDIATNNNSSSGGVNYSNNSLVNSLMGRKIKTTGLMSKLFRDTAAHSTAPGSAALERVNSFTVHRSSNLTPGGRMFTSATKRSGGGGDNNSAGSVTSASDEVSKAMVPDAVVASVNNAMFCSLADSLFLIGPSAQGIQEQINAHTTTSSGGDGAGSFGASSPSPIATVSDFNANLPSSIIFVTDVNSPPEMFTLLPCYTYPSGVEVGVRSAAKNITGKSSSEGKKHRTSLNLLSQKIITESITDAVKGVKKKNTAFFPSDFNLGASMGLGAKNESAAAVTAATAASTTTSTTAAATAHAAAIGPTTAQGGGGGGGGEPPSVLPAVNSHMSARNPFILLLGDHTYQQYGVCIQLPVTFHTDQGITIQTSYVLCLMTKLPLFSYLCHILDQYDAFFDGFKFKAPLPTQDLNFPFIAELKPLSDLAAKLKRLLVPKYPYIISNALSTAPTSTRKRATTALSAADAANLSNALPVTASVVTTGGGVSGGGLLDQGEFPSLENDSDTKALLPDVEFGYGGININKKLHATFKRSVYQSYFSTAGLKYDSHNKVLSDAIARYDKMAADFLPNATHKSEKDKEESYLVMLWALPVLLKYLPLDQIVLALGCAVTEMRIIVQHPDFHVISAIILAFMQLLRPLRWCSPVIVILPDQYQEIIESPTPVMIGMQRLPQYFELLEGFVVVDPQERIVHLNPIDVVESHTILLPHGSKLVNALSPSAETILKCTKKKRHTRQHRRSLQPAEPDPHGETSHATHSSSVPPIFVPLPVELDTDSYENLQLLAAVNTFSSLVSNHIQAILNTAIQLQQQSKQASQEQRRLLIRSQSGPRHQGHHNQHPSGKSAKPKPIAAAVTATPTTTAAPMSATAATAITGPPTTASVIAAAGAPGAVDAASQVTVDAAKQKVADIPAAANQGANRNSHKIDTPLTPKQSNDNFPGAALVSNVHSPLVTDAQATTGLANMTAAVATTAAKKDSNAPKKLTPTKLLHSKSSQYIDTSSRDTKPKLMQGNSPGDNNGPRPAKLAKASSARLSMPPAAAAKKDLPSPGAMSAPGRSDFGGGGGVVVGGKEIDELAALNDSPSSLRGAKQLKTRQTLLVHPNTGAEERRKKLLAAKAADNHDKDRRSSTGNHKGAKAAPAKKAADDKAKAHKTAIAQQPGLGAGIAATSAISIQEESSAKAAHPGSTGPLTSETLASSTAAGEARAEAKTAEVAVLEPFSPVARNGTAAPLVFNIDSLVSPFVYPPTAKRAATNANPNVAAAITTASAPPEAAEASSSATSEVTEPTVVSPVFLNLPHRSNINISSNSAEDGEFAPRDSLNDETCSDITVTDAGGGHHHAPGDDGSGGGGGDRARTEFSNDSGDKMSDIAESHSSTSSSLPSLKNNAPLLLVREIGQSGAKFMEKIQETQMYSNYCQHVKNQSALAAAKAAEQKATGQGGLTSTTQEGSLDSPVNLATTATTTTTPRAGLKAAWSQLLLNAEGESIDLLGAGWEDATAEEEEIELDSLHEVFSVLLTGTIAPSKAALAPLFSKYEELYKDSQAVSPSVILAKYSDVFDKVRKQSNLDAVYEDAVRKYNISRTADRKSSGAPSSSSGQGPTGTGTVGPASISGFTATGGEEKEEAVTTVDPPVVWCNGLLCAGLCNTPLCTSICIALWEYKVKKLRQQAVFRNIITKSHQHHHHHSQANPGSSSKHVLQVLASPAGAKSASALQHNGKAVTVTIQSKVEVVKHHKETQSQFEQRKALVENRKAEFLRLHSLNAHTEAANRPLNGKQRSVFGPALRDKKKILYARGRTSDPATLAVAKYYAAKQIKVRKSQEVRALCVIKPLMMRFICLYRRFKFFNAIYIIQALIRGFYVRNHIPELVEALIARRIRRLLACIRIRRFLRQRADQIYRRHVRAKIEEQRRRRATLSIPVKMGSQSAKTAADAKKSSTNRPPRKIYSLSDDILPASGISLFGAEKEKPQVLGATALTKPTAEDINSMINEKAMTSAAPMEGVSASAKEFGSEFSSTSQESAASDTGATAGSAKESASQKVTPRYNTGTYTDRVKEYLQFGKIINRTASTSAVQQQQQQNKYAAHYMQKRNSKTAKGLEGGATTAVALSPDPPVVRSAAIASSMPTEAAMPSPDDTLLQQAQESPTSAASLLFPGLTSSEDAASTPDHYHAPSDATEDASKAASFDSPNPFAAIVGEADGSTSEGANANTETVQHRPTLPRAKRNLHIATNFSSSTEDSDESEKGDGEGGEDGHQRFVDAPSTMVSADSTIGSPSSAFSPPAAKENIPGAAVAAGSEMASQVVESLPAPEILSPTSGIRILSDKYTDSDDDAERNNNNNNCSLRFSDYGSELNDDNSVSLLAMNLVEGSLRHYDSTSTGMKDSMDWSGDSPGGNRDSIAYSKGVPPTAVATTTAGGVTADEDDRASVLSSNSNSTTPQRRASYNGSTTDVETAQPMLHSILAHHQGHNARVSLLSVSSDNSAGLDRDTTHIAELSDAEQLEPLGHAEDQTGRLQADDCTVVTASSMRSNRSAARFHGKQNNNTSMLIDTSQSKKLSPIGRYAAEKSYDMTRLFTPRTASMFNNSRVPFQSQQHMDDNSSEGDTTALLGTKETTTLSPLQRYGLTAHPPQPMRTPRGSLPGEATARPVRRQTFMLNNTSLNRRFSSLDENMVSGDNSGGGGGGVGVAPQDKLSSLRSYPIDDLGLPADRPDGTAAGNNWTSQTLSAKDRAQRRSTTHFYVGQNQLPGVPVASKVGSMSEDTDENAFEATDRLSFKELRVAVTESSDWSQHPDEQSMLYHRHSKSTSPKAGGASAKGNVAFSIHTRDTDGSPVRPNNGYSQAIDQEAHAYKVNKIVEGGSDFGRPRRPSEQLGNFHSHSNFSSNSSRAASPRYARSRSMDERDGEEGDEEEGDEEDLVFTDDLQAAVKAAPLKTLGCNVTDFINRQQLTTLLDMWSLLREGVEVLKHGRRGNPKFKSLLCDVNLTKLYWRSPESKPDPDQDNLPEDLQYYPTLLDPTAGAAELSNGVPPADSVPTSSTSRMQRTTFGAKSNADRVLYIRDILEVREDCSTEVMQRSVAKRFVSVGRTSVISIVLVDRTLDFEIEEVNWGPLFHALRILVNFYQVMVPSPRVTFSASRPPDGFFNFLTYDTTAGGGGGGNEASAVVSSGMQYSTAPAGRRKRSGSSFGAVLKGSGRASGKGDAQESESLI